MKKLLVLILIIFLLSVSLSSEWGNEEKEIATPGSYLDYFGRSVSLSGNYAVIGAPTHQNIHAPGDSYIFLKDDSGWSQQAHLTSTDGSDDDFFGFSVSISGNYAVVGAHGDDDNGNSSGSAYVFYRNGDIWLEQTKLTASDGDSSDHFGFSVSVSGDYIVIGAYGDSDNGMNTGAAYIFKREGENWIEQSKITASDGHFMANFGNSVSISGDFALIGSVGDYSGGSAYIFRREGENWFEHCKLTNPAGAILDCFGSTVSISEEYAIIGAPWDDEIGNNAGKAYVFFQHGFNWILQDELLASDGSEEDCFGFVSINNNFATVGAYCDDDNGSDSGSAYIFQRVGESWTELIKLTASDGNSYDNFGLSVSLYGNFVLIGAPDAGSVYFYENQTVSTQPYTIQNTTEIELLSAYPNPFNPSTTIEFTIQNDSKIGLTIFNIKGQLVKTLTNNKFNKGAHSINWNGVDDNGNSISSGVYYYQLNVNGKTEKVNKCLLLK